MEKIFNAAKILVAGLFLCGMILIGNKASAAEVNQEALDIFRETLIQTSKRDTRVFHQDILFVMPRFTGELEFMGATENDSLKLNGAFELWMVDDKGIYEHTEIPFYLVQDKQNMVLYFKSDKKWQKTTAPVTAANAVDMFATPSQAELEKFLEYVKDVTILQETDKKRVMLVKIDGAKVAETIAKSSEELKNEILKESTEENKVDEKIAEDFANYLYNGLKNAEIWYTWSVDKVNWQTTTASFNLSGLVQSVALAVLNDKDQALTSFEPVREILETLAYYSEFKGYTTFLGAEAKSKLEVPKNVLKAKEVSADDKSKKK